MKSVPPVPMSRAKKNFLSYRSLKRMASDKWGDMSVWAGLGYGLKLTGVGRRGGKKYAHRMSWNKWPSKEPSIETSKSAGTMDERRACRSTPVAQRRTSLVHCCLSAPLTAFL